MHSGIDLSEEAKWTTIDVLAEWEAEFIPRIKAFAKSNKRTFDWDDAMNHEIFHTDRDKQMIGAWYFLKSNPLKNNDYSKYVTTYINEGRKLNIKYFRNNKEKLEGYYRKADEAKAEGRKFNPFSWMAYKNYVCYMIVSLDGNWMPSDDILFHVEPKESRLFNPATKIPSVLRGELPFEIEEQDMVRAFATFIDIELGTEYRKDVYGVYGKVEFNTLININESNKGATYDGVIKKLRKLYGDDAEKVLTLERFNEKGKTYRDLTVYEKDYCEKYVQANGLTKYVRLHDGIIVKKGTVCNVNKIGIVEFAKKQFVKPKIEQEVMNFYSIDPDTGKILTSRTRYANFLIENNFIRLSTPDDKIVLLRDSNNVVDAFNHNTNILNFFQEHINENEFDSERVNNWISGDIGNIRLAFPLIPARELVYYSDPKNGFGLPFKNGFWYMENGELKSKEYSEVKGFFTPHKIQSRNFAYTEEIGMFETFLTRAAIGHAEALDDEETSRNREFQKMLGYLCHTHRSKTQTPCMIFTDAGADDEHRNGGRGKTVLTEALYQVQERMFKGGKEFNPEYTHVFADLEKKHRIYVIDDVPAGFKYDALYTNVFGGINCQRKGLKAEMIEFEESPKFVLTTNWVLPYSENDASTNRRFFEYKFSDYYNLGRTPKIEFGCEFFGDWDADEWNRFYSFIFRCVERYLNEGLTPIKYDKTDDNYRVVFYNPVICEEFERILNNLADLRLEFTVSDFLAMYNDYQNPLKNMNLFHHKNVKKIIDTWFAHHATDPRTLEWKYVQRSKKWVKSDDATSINEIDLDALRFKRD